MKLNLTGNSQNECIKTFKLISFILLFNCREKDLNLFRTIHYCLLSFSFFILFPIYSRYSLLISDSPELLQYVPFNVPVNSQMRTMINVYRLTIEFNGVIFLRTSIIIMALIHVIGR